MTSFFVDHLSYSLGDITNTVEEAVRKGLTVSEASSLRDAGFSFQHRCSPEKTSYDLARDCVAKIGNNLENIGAIIYSTCIPANAAMTNDRFVHSRDVKGLMDFPASHLQQEFNLERASVLGLSQQACTGMLG